jgi:hypothetical protein
MNVGRLPIKASERITGTSTEILLIYTPIDIGRSEEIS